MTKTEFVTDRQWDSYARRIERHNLKTRGKTLTFTGIAARANKFIIDIRSDQKGMIVRVGWRDAMKDEISA